jgi:Fe-S-cluster containining protein
MASYSYPKQQQFQCERCATCCMDTRTHVRRVLLLKNEAKHISRVSEKPMEEFITEVVGHEPYAYEMKKTPEDKKCVFLEGNSCRIYAIRPLVCRFYPFQLSKEKGQKYSFSVTAECPGVGKGEPLKKGFFEDLFRKACEKFE